MLEEIKIEQKQCQQKSHQQNQVKNSSDKLKTEKRIIKLFCKIMADK